MAEPPPPEKNLVHMYVGREFLQGV
jgi:hypothetical protein